MVLYPTDIVIILLAYDGVWQPDAWNLWLEKANGLPISSRIHLMVHTPEKLKTKHSFEKTYDINRFDKNTPLRFGRTGWCQMTIVTETLKAFQKAYTQMAKTTTQEDRVHYYLVSGACIPVKPARLLFETPYVPILRLIDNGTYSTHSQWMVLTHAYMELLLKKSIIHPELPLTSNDDLTDAVMDIYLQTNAMYGFNQHCPDEYMIGALLGEALFEDPDFKYEISTKHLPSSLTITKHIPMTMHQWKVSAGNPMLNPYCCDASPITWKNTDKKYTLRDVGSGFKTSDMTASLSTLLLYSRLYYIYLDPNDRNSLVPMGFFMRKLSRSLPFKDIQDILEVIYSNEIHSTTNKALLHQFKEQLTLDKERPLGNYQETLREDTALPKTPSPPKTKETSSSPPELRMIEMSPSLEDVFRTNGHPARPLFYQPLRDAHFNITQMEKEMTKDLRQRSEPKKSIDAALKERIQAYVASHPGVKGGRRRTSWKRHG
jgi:hypothetical protein